MHHLDYKMILQNKLLFINNFCHIQLYADNILHLEKIYHILYNKVLNVTN